MAGGYGKVKAAQVSQVKVSPSPMTPSTSIKGGMFRKPRVRTTIGGAVKAESGGTVAG